MSPPTKSYDGKEGAWPRLVLPLTSVDRSMTSIVGGKAANLGDMIQSAGLPVPRGFVLTSESYREFLAFAKEQSNGELEAILGQLNALSSSAAQQPPEQEEDLLTTVRRLGEQIRAVLQNVPIPPDVRDATCAAWDDLQAHHHQTRRDAKSVPLAVAVRSSATAEDLPSASFAGQQDTYLNIVGKESVIQHVHKCWISLFTDRAIIYRIKNHFDHTKVYLCVVVQQQIHPTSAGIMFTADAVTSRRNVTVIEAGYGLGEALVSGLINADQYKFDRTSQELVEVTVGDKSLQIVPVYYNDAGVGGTETVPLEEPLRTSQVLSTEQIHALIQIGEDVKNHYQGVPQDIEWCIEHGTNQIYVVQSRPITTLFPLPEQLATAADPAALRVYVSFGHIQVMTDPIPFCGLSVWKHFFPFGRTPPGRGPLQSAGCHLYMDVTRIMHISFLRNKVLGFALNVSGALGASLKHVVERPSFLSTPPKDSISTISFMMQMLKFAIPIWSKVFWRLFLQPRPEQWSVEASKFTDAVVRQAKTRIQSSSEAPQRVEAAINELDNLWKDAIWIMPSAAAGMISFSLIRKMIAPTRTADLEALARGLTGNVTTDMDLAIGDLADIARMEPTVVGWLKGGKDLSYEGLSQLNKSQSVQFRTAFSKFLDKYGVRGNGEIDISRPRWRDDPSPILQVIRGNLTNTEPGHHRKHHQELATAGEEAAQRIVASAPWYKRFLLRRLVRTARSLGALREHHKFLMIQVFFEARRSVLDVAADLMNKGYLESKDDIWLLTLEEVADSLNWDKNKLRTLIKERREEYERYSKLKPPTVLTSEGECVNIQPDHGDIPDGALGGLAVSPGNVEGIAKVVTDPTVAVLHSGEILVCPFTDPGWTPLFINAAGVVMEVGGYLTHGSVVSREYGIPAVSSVENATTVIQTGMKLRVDGRRGFVQIIKEEDTKEE